MSESGPAMRRLRAVVEADPGAVIRVLQQFQMRNLMPRRVIAQALGHEYIEVDIEIDAATATAEAFSVIVAKVNQMVNVMAAVVCPSPGSKEGGTHGVGRWVPRSGKGEEGAVALIALVRPPTASIEVGLSTCVDRQPIDFARAQVQHINYVAALRDAGAQVVALPAIEHLPDAVFIEDTALVLDSVAVMARSGAEARRAEAPTVAGALSNYCYLAHLPEGACFDGGDVLVIERTVYLGLTQRTNQAAIDFLKTLLRQYYYDAVAVPVSGCLHLKSAVTSLGDNTVLINPQWVPREAFAKHVQIDVAMAEPMGANALRVGTQLLMSASYSRTAKRVEAHGLIPKLINISEFHKAEGGLTCLSILHAT